MDQHAPREEDLSSLCSTPAETVSESEPTETMILLDCGLLDEGEEPHIFPGDWVFGGADGNDPGADPRWESSSYHYLNEFAQTVWVTSAPLCEHQALDQFTLVSSFGDLHPRYLEVRHPGESTYTVLPWEYRESADTLHPMVSANA